jgi:hypothetical protein
MVKELASALRELTLSRGRLPVLDTLTNLEGAKG